MKKLLLPVSACLLACSSLFISCNNDAAKKEGPASNFNLDSVRAKIDASNKEYGACFATGDSVKFAGFYTADACINPPNMPRMCGSKAIMSFFVGGTKMGIKNIKLTIDEVMGSDAAVAEIGKYDLLGDKDASMDKGKYIVVWKQVDGKWLMHRDEWNSDNPPPPPPSAEKK